jgi:TonB-linked SusC/RagA family outer membrane protein
MKSSILLGLIGLTLTVSLAAQEKYWVEGQIINSKQEPISNVSVSFEGAPGAPVFTDSAGMFTLEVISRDIWLTISPLADYKPKQIFLGGRSKLKVYLQRLGMESGSDWIRYSGGTIQRRNLVSDVWTGEWSKEFSKISESFDLSLAGRSPGLYNINMSGMPGSGSYLSLRAINSIYTTSQPLIIVDGMPVENAAVMQSLVDGYNFNPAASIDPNDVANISLIKGGAALSSYGLKGSNGLVLIETLNPSETTTSIDFMYKLGINVSGKMLPQLNTNQYKTFAKEMLFTSPFSDDNFEQLFPGLFYTPDEDEYIRYGHDSNWQKEVFNNSLMHNTYLSVKGGDAIARFGLSLGYLKHNGIFKNTYYNRFNTRFVGTFNIFNWLRIYASANLVSSDAEYKESGRSIETSPVLTALFKSPQLYPLAYDSNGDLINKVDDVEELGISNPTAVIEKFKAGNHTYRFLTSLRVEGDISDNLKWSSILGLNINDIKENVFMPNLGMEFYYDDEAYNVSKSLNGLFFSLYNDNYLTYKNRFDEIHDVRLIAGFKWQSNEFQDDIGVSMNSNENDQYTNVGPGDNQLRIVSGNNEKWTWFSNYLNASYTFRDKYLVEAAISADMSSTIGKEANSLMQFGGVPVGIFYGFGGAWRLSGEAFMHDFERIEDLKIHLMHETSGNDDVGTSNIFSYYTTRLFRGTSGMIPGGIPNEGLRHEYKTQTTIGIELNLMNRFRISANYFAGNIDDVLIYKSLDSYFGYPNYPSNSGIFEFKGYDTYLMTRLMQKSKSYIDIGITLSHTLNTVRSIEDNDYILQLPGGSELINRTGMPVNSFFGYDYIGVIESKSEADQLNLVNGEGIPFRAGDAHFRDISGAKGEADGIINDYDKVILGSASPELYGGISLVIGYKRWEVNILWQYVYGNEIFNYLRYQNESMTDLSNQSAAVLNRWSYDGQDTDIPRSYWGDPVGNSAFSTRWIESGSFLRLKSVNLSYNIPEGALFFKNLHVFLTASNLLTFSRYLGYDPEFSYSFQPYMQGIDFGLMPQSRKIIMGIKFGL